MGCYRYAGLSLTSRSKTVQVIHSRLLMHAEYLRSQLEHPHRKKTWKIITLVRDPVARTISAFFQQFERKVLTGQMPEVLPGDKNYEETLDKLLTEFDTKYLRDSKYDHPYLWFEKELKDNFGCNLLQESGIKDKYYYICRVENVEVLLLKLEFLNNCYQAAFQDFLGVNNFGLKPENLRSQKTCGSLYEDFLNRVNLPSTYLDQIYYSNLVRNFYSDSEIEVFYRRWQKS